MMKESRIHNRSGFSLVEAVLAMSILSFSTLGVLIPFVSGAQIRAEGMRRSLAANLASDFMERAVITGYDGLLSYDGFSEGQGEIANLNGDKYDDSRYADFSREIACENVYMVPESGDQAAKYIKVVVKVYYQGGEMAQLTRLFCR